MAKVTLVLTIAKEFEANTLSRAEYLADDYVQQIKAHLPFEEIENHIYVEEE